MVKAKTGKWQSLTLPKALTLTSYHHKAQLSLSFSSYFGSSRLTAECLKNVSRHYSSCVRNVSFFQVFLNNEKLPFILELSSNNQMYLGITNVIYRVPPNKQIIFLLSEPGIPVLVQQAATLTTQGRGQECTLFTVHDPSSHTVTLQGTSVHKQFSTMSCVKSKVTKILKCSQTQVCIWKQFKGIMPTLEESQ